MTAPTSLLLQAEESIPGLARGTASYRRASLALFLAGFATFSLLYCVQPLLPEFTRDYHVTPATSALALSFSTGALAFSIFVSGALSQMLPRRGLMFASMLLAAVCNLLAAASPGWSMLLLARFMEGLVLGGVPAVAMAWLAEEVRPADLGKAMGLYVAGTAFGGMMGRVGMGVMLNVGSWRLAMALLGGLGLCAAVGFAMLLPPSRQFTVSRSFDPRQHVSLWATHLRQRDLPRLFGIGFVLTSVFVTVFNYAGFRLLAPPFSLGQTAISAIFLSYISGIFASPWAGSLADRFGRKVPLVGALAVMATGVAVTCSTALVLVVLGILMVTVGFFAAHAIASGWIGRLAGDAKGHASALYLLCYYMGSSIIGSVGGWFWQHLGWNGVAGLTATLALIGVSLGLSLRETKS